MVLPIIGGAIAAVSAAIGTIIATVGPAVAGALTAAKALVLGSGTLGLSDYLFISKAIIELGQMLGIIDGQSNSEELGAKACEAEKNPDDFDTTADYIKYLENEVSLDKDRFTGMSEEELAAYKILGAGILAKGIEEKTKVVLTPEILETVGKHRLEGKEVYGILEACKDSGIKSASKIDDYMGNKLPLEERIKVGVILEEGLQKSGMTIEAAEERLEAIELGR